jgi:hypothetical protein
VGFFATSTSKLSLGKYSIYVEHVVDELNGNMPGGLAALPLPAMLSQRLHLANNLLHKSDLCDYLRRTMGKSTPRRGAEILLQEGVSEFSSELQGYIRRGLGGALSCTGIIGTNIYTRDWDVLILLDTCRVDAIKQVAGEYEFLTDIQSIWSVGATSAEWIAATFSQSYLEEIRNTAYLTNNGFAHKIYSSESNYSLPEPFLTGWNPIDESDFGRLEHIWKYQDHIEDFTVWGSDAPVPPEYVTDRGISVNRNRDFDREILHYLRPHSPYVAPAVTDERPPNEYEREPFEYLKAGGDTMAVYEAYVDNLRTVLDSVGVLLDNIDADRVVISADHGEAFGEYGEYGHPFGSLNPVVRKVPWVVTSATDTGQYSSKYDPVEDSTRDIDGFLAALGYK